MSTKGKFINPPLIVLAYGTNERERLETLAQWAIIDVGKRTHEHWQKRICAPSPMAAINHFCRSAKHRQAETNDPVWQAFARLDKALDQHGIDHTIDNCTWGLGVDVLGINPQWLDADTCLAGHRRLSEFIARMQSMLCRGDKHPVPVRGLKVDWFMATLRTLWKGRDWPGEQLSYTHFAVLCAVLSKIGTNTPPAKASGWQEIQRRALGYGTPDEMRLAMPYRQDGVQPMSRDMIDHRTQQLALWGFFVRHTPMIGKKAQVCWYGSGIDRAKLVKIAEAAKVKAKGGWKARWKAMQAKQTATHDNVIAFESGLFPAHHGRSDGNQQQRTGGERTA